MTYTILQHDVAADAYYAEHDEKLALNAVIWFSSHVERFCYIKQVKLRIGWMHLAPVNRQDSPTMEDCKIYKREK